MLRSEHSSDTSVEYHGIDRCNVLDLSLQGWRYDGHLVHTIKSFMVDSTNAISFALLVVQILHLEIDYHSLTKRSIQADAADVANMEERLASVAASMEVSTTTQHWMARSQWDRS